MPSTFKPYDQMTDEDYLNLGLQVGLEVHQQLLTRRKLFCRCPAGRYSTEYDAEILRHMRPTLSELGEYDGTALMEKKTQKNIYYRIHHDTVCTYEFDDTPPFHMDAEALDIGLEIALLLRLNLVSELHIARKQYLDGSIPTGFQRTTILGVDGWIPYRGRRIGIIQLGLEEDACREVSDIGHDRVYLTDRLGMPLVETVTYPDMRTPQEAAEVGQIIRRLCRSTGKVRTGYGAGRQDVNVSIKGGTRIEIKGTPQIWRNPRLIYNEARRQYSLLRIRDELWRRGVREEHFHAVVQDVTHVVRKTEYEPIQTALAFGRVVKCILLKRFADLLSEPTQENTTFAKEFSDRVRVIACLTRLPNIVHSDAASDSLPGRDWKTLRRKMRAQDGDALVLVWGNEADTACACREIENRAREATVGVPSDTRQWLLDGTNGFERVLPGAERMYPDTDLPPLAIEQTRLDRIKVRLPEFIWDRQARYHELGLSEELASQLCVSPRAGLFDRLVSELSVNPVFAAVVLLQRLKALRRAGLPVGQLTDDDVYAVFKAHVEQHVPREAIPLILGTLAEIRATRALDTATIEKACQDVSPGRVDAAALTRLIERRLAELNGQQFATPEQECRYLIGVLRRELAGRAAARDVARLVRTRLHVIDAHAQAEAHA